MSECIEWAGAKTPQGYGQRKMARAMGRRKELRMTEPTRMAILSGGGRG